MVRLVLVLAILVASARARADDSVALLPFDTEKKLELYGQPVASEIAKALTGEHINVVVVGAKMAVPESARLIVDGTISAGKGDSVHLTARIRDRATGTTVAKLAADAPAVTSIDAAEASLAKDVLQNVRDQLAKKTTPPPIGEPKGPDQPVKAPTPPAMKAIVVTVAPGPLQELGPAATDWAMQHHRAVAAAGENDFEATITLEPLAYDVTEGAIPTARARVRVRISDRAKTKKFDRVVVTDTVVGDKNIDKSKLAARVAREVLAIVEPHMRHAVEAWR
jgi:hypothetical protein